MRPPFFVGLFLLTGVPLWSQVVPSGSGGNSGQDEYQMSMPTQVSGGSYSVSTTERSNYLSAGLLFSAAYDDNYFAGQGTGPSGVTSLSLYPTINLSRTSLRQSYTLNYGVGFSFFEPITNYNSINQTLSGDASYRLSRHTSLSIAERFQQNSNVLNQPYTSGTSVSGSTIGLQQQFIVPYADQRYNSTAANFGYQVSRDALIGLGGTYGFFHFPNGSESVGLNNSDYADAAAFYTRRMSRSQYLGVMYRYGRTTTNPIDTTTNTQTGSVIYSLDLGHRFTLSATAGPEYFDTQEVGFAQTSSLGSMVNASFNWHEKRTALAASYSQSITTGQGLVGAYHTNAFDLSGTWQFARRWSAGISGMYTNFKNAAPTVVSSNPGGHTLFGSVEVVHSLTEHITLQADYRRLHQTYEGIAAVYPDDDRVSGSISYTFRRPLGR